MENNVYTIVGFMEENYGSGYLSAYARVKGYWSDVISLRLQRDWFGEEQKWKMSMSHSSGGRDTKEVVCDLEAEENFAKAIAEMAAYGRQFLAQNRDVIEAAFQAQRAEEKAKREAERLAEEKKIADDVTLDKGEVLRIMIALNTGSYVKMFRRGSDRPTQITMTERGNKRYYIGGEPVAKNKVIETLEKASHRTMIVN